MLLSEKSINKLVGLHPQLTFFVVQLMIAMNERKKKNLNYTDFSVFEGIRSYERQKELFKNGKTKTLNSFHLKGLAVDLLVYIPTIGVTWDDKKYKNNWDVLLEVAQNVIKENGLSIHNGFKQWGWDKPHFQITQLKNKFNYEYVIKENLRTKIV